MPRKPRVTHPLREIRRVHNMTQPAFAKFVGCSAITIQRIENRTLRMSEKLADRILEATGANPVELRAGRKAVDTFNRPYTKESYQLYQSYLQESRHDLSYYMGHLAHWIQLLLIASQRSGQDKLQQVFAAVQRFLAKTAEEFDLKKNIHGFLIEKAQVLKRKYLVSDLRKFPEYARIIGFKDNKRFKPSKVIDFAIPFGWIVEFSRLHEKVIFPPEINRKLGKKNFIVDTSRPIPDTPEFKELKEALPHALYWRIKKFWPTLT